MFGREQRGATLIGTVVIVAILGFALYAGIRLFPLYMEYMAVARAMEQTAKEAKEGTSPQALKQAMDRRWVIEDIKSIDPAEIKITRARNGYTMQASYRAMVPFIANVSLAADFDKTVEVVVN
jgi:Flp pilus assembly protein TadG